MKLVLRSKNCRLFFTGQGISLIGTWMTKVAAGWLVYQLTHSALLLGLVAFTDDIASLLLAPFTGVFLDQWNRQRVLIITQTFAMLHALSLAVLTLTGNINIYGMIALSLCQGCIKAFDVPARQVFIAEIVENKPEIGEAIALNSFIISSGRLLGPALAGIAIAQLGSGLCFLIDGLTYLFIIAALLLIQLSAKNNHYPKVDRPWKKLQRGFAYVVKFSDLGWILLLLGLVSFMAMPYASLAPIFAKEILQGNAETLGFLLSFAGLGSLTGSIYLIWRKRILGLEKIIPLSTGLAGLSLMIFSQSENLLISLISLYLIGLALSLQVASSNTMLQILSPDDKRGRIMSLFTIAFIGMTPLGNLFSGFVSDRLGVVTTLTINGLICLIAAAIFSQQVHPLKRSLKRMVSSES
ncbi:MFS transporter [Oxynema sp. CENA135]|jgi:MFS family permease|uniref:MFS transporter n=1 Tax=Oxynema sp. CENA135 TaxID=984206 RepID=UPI00190BE190|nr:MFS transporter [Oxynema sp. CENA135]MBK4728883.1 MFS transporter [Oxynema sp. CENA135]